MTAPPRLRNKKEEDKPGAGIGLKSGYAQRDINPFGPTHSDDQRKMHPPLQIKKNKKSFAFPNMFLFSRVIVGKHIVNQDKTWNKK